METTKLATFAAVAAISYLAGRMVTLKKIENNIQAYTVLDTAEQMSIIENVMAAHGYTRSN